MIIFSLIILNISIGLYIINNYFFNYEKYGIYKKKNKNSLDCYKKICSSKYFLIYIQN